MFYNSLDSSYQLILSSTILSKPKSKIDLRQLTYFEYTNNHSNNVVKLLLCFYLKHLIGVKIIEFKHKVIQPTHILKDTIIWDYFNNYQQKNLDDKYYHWIDFLDSYFIGKLKLDNKAVSDKNKIISLELACLHATLFQFSVWKELLKVKNISTYSNIAFSINNSKAVRAVGTAVSQNPIAILIPCHRILPKNIFNSGANNDIFNDVGQYMHGAEFKKFLLNLEFGMQV